MGSLFGTGTNRLFFPVVVSSHGLALKLFDNASANPEPGLFSKRLQFERVSDSLWVIALIQVTTQSFSAQP